MMYPDEKRRFLLHWKPHHQRGKYTYLLRATLAVTGLMLLVSVLFDWAFGDTLSEALAANITAPSIVGKTFLGLVWAFWQWHGQEALFRKLER